MKEYYMVMDVAKCHDCNNCFIACKDEHVGNDWAPYQRAMPRHGHRWMDIMRRERGEAGRVDMAFLPKPCMQCGDAPCKGACPGVVKIRPDGIVQLDIGAAGGNNMTDACPYGSIWWNEEERVSQKCDFCAHLLDDGWETPRCVHSCPTGALAFYSEEPEAFRKRVSDEGLSAYLPELSDRPHMWYKNLHRFTKNFVAGQVLKGGDCAAGVTIRLSGAGVEAEQATDFFGEYRFDGLDDGAYTAYAGGKELGSAQVAGGSVNMGEFEI